MTSEEARKPGSPEARKPGSPEARKPGSPEARNDRWGTAPVQRRVLAVVRTLTALDRLYDVFPALADDIRVETRFVVAAGSQFNRDLSDHLRRAGMRVVDWGDATSENFDLAISPSSNGELHELRLPLLTVSHGAGHHKYRATETGHAREVSGLSRTQLLHEGTVIPSVIGLSHDSQHVLLRDQCPEAADRVVVIGDPCYDRLRASVPSREHYRREFGTGDRTLVLVASTWGPCSLLHGRPQLARELALQLPQRSYQVAMVLHPNIWDRHSPFQIKQWTQSARSAGLVLVPPDRGWRAALTAADVVISDHGSLGIYAAALGKRVLLAGTGTDEIVPETPADRLTRLAPRLTTVDTCRAVCDAAELADHESFAAETFAWRGKSTRRLRQVIFEQLGLPEPDWDVPAEPVEPFIP